VTVKLPPVQDALRASAPLVAIVQTRIYQTQAPEDAARPYVVWGIVSAVPEIQLSAPPEDDDQRVQVDCYSDTQTQSRAMIAAAADACETIGNIVFGPWSSFETDTKVYRWSFDVEIWNPR
jgi:hypothetical protein